VLGFTPTLGQSGVATVFARGPIVYGVQRADGAPFFGHLSHQKSAKMD